MSSSFFGRVQPGLPIEVFQKNKMFVDCPSSNKVNLTVGAYRTAEGKPWVLPVVREAEKLLAADPTQNHEYLPVLGYQPFCDAAVKLVLGPGCQAVNEDRVFGIQCLSGTGSLRVGAEFLNRQLGFTNVFVSDPTWENHNLVFKNSGFTGFRKYRYWDHAKRKLDIEGMLSDLESAPLKCCIVLHGCAHNPTGMDPTKEEWKRICDVIERKKVLPFFDLAYQGFASGDPDDDAWAVRYFVSRGLEVFVAQSFAKNFGLYNERTGNLTVVVKDPSCIPAVKSQFSLVVRANWSNPPNHGAKIVHMVLTTADMLDQWHDHMKQMSTRIREMRRALRDRLEGLGTPGTWDHITSQIGMFSYTGLTSDQVLTMIEDHHVFLLNSGRINVCGLNMNNVDYVADSIHSVLSSIPSHI